MADQAQTYKNHARLFPPFHFFVVPVLLINFIASIVRVYLAPSVTSGWGVVVAAALVMLALTARMMANAVQDRVIRLEMRLRLAGNPSGRPSEPRERVDAAAVRGAALRERR